MSHDLATKCAEAMRVGMDFPTLWHTIIRPHPSVIGIPVQKITEDRRPYVEVPLLRGEWRVLDYQAKAVRLR